MTKKVDKKTSSKKDTIGMAPAVHRSELEKDIDKINHRIDTLIDDFGNITETHKKKIDRLCVRIGINKM